MKLVQLNVWEGRLTRLILSFLEREKPDIVCMQEVFSSTKPVRVPHAMFDTLQLIKAQTGHEHVLFSPIHTGVYAGASVDFGNAIVSRFPLAHTATIVTNGRYNPDFTYAARPGHAYNLQVATVQLPHKSFTLLNHHGHWEADPMGSQTSIEKMQLVCEVAKRQPSPLVLTGDLNVQSESPAMRVFDGFLQDLTATHHIASTLSSLGKAVVACDHILVSPDVQVKSFAVKDDLISDHKALVMEFDI